MSAEFTRNLWIEANPVRFAAATGLVAGLFVLLWTFEGNASADDIYESAYWIGFLSLTFWGSRRVADSVAGEWVAGTWDQQLMAHQSSLSLALGKLFGAPSLAWWVALLCAGAMFATATEPPGEVVLRMMAVGLVAQSLAMVLTLAVHRGMGGRFRGEVTAVQLAALGGALALNGFLQLADEAGMMGVAPLVAARMALYMLAATQMWWGRFVPPETVGWALIASVVVWSWVGSWRLLRAERGQQDMPWAWLAFLVFLTVAVGGFIDAAWEALVPVAVFLLAFYASALVEPKGWLRLQAWRDAWVQGEGGRAIALTPLWVWAAVFLAGAALYAAGPYGMPGWPYVAPALALFALRDVALLHLLTLQGRRSGLLFAVLTILILYGAGGLLVGAGLPPYVLLPVTERAAELLAPALQAAAALAGLVALQRRAARRAALAD